MLFRSYYHGASTPKDNAVTVAGGVFYVSEDGFYQLSKEPKKISGSISQLIAPSDALVNCTYFDSRVWFCTGHTLVALNVATGSWEKYQYGTTNVNTQDIIFGGDHLYLGMGTTGNILQLDVENTTTPGHRAWYLSTPVLNQGITSADKRYKTLFVYTKNTSSVMHVSCELDYGTGKPVSDIFGVEAGDKWGTMLWGTGYWSVSSSSMTVYKRSIVADVARTIRLRFSGSGDVALLGYAIVYTPKRKYGVR